MNLRTMLAGSADKVARYVAAGDAARDQRQWTDAASSYAKALELAPSLAGIWVQYGHALKESGSVSQAILAYRKSIALDPNVADTHLQLGHGLKLAGETPEAVAAYIAALKLDENLEYARHELRQMGWSAQDLRDLIRNLDVAGEIKSARRPDTRHDLAPESASRDFDEQLYLATFPDVRRLVDLGVVSSGRQHYVHYGYRQGRDIVRSLAEKPASRVFVLCPSFFKPCGIGEHTRYLADCIERSGLEVLRIRSTRDLGAYPEEKLKDAMILVNHGPGLFDGHNPLLSEGETTADLLAVLSSNMRRHNLRPVIFMHSLLDRDNEVMFPRQQLALEHPVPILTTIESASRVFNIFRVEHGMQPMAVSQRAPQVERARDNPTIGFFGFFQWGGKNFDALFNLARAVNGKLVGSVATGDAADIQKLRDMLSEMHITCDLGVGWVDDSELASRLAGADFYYLPQFDYDHWNNSGTTRFVMNFGRPIIVPPSNPFLDLRDHVIFAEEHDLPQVISWLREDGAYEAASRRTAHFMRDHAMADEMPKIVTALPRIVAETGSAAFDCDGLYSALDLLMASTTAFAARVADRLGAGAATPVTGEALSIERLKAIESLRAANPGQFELNYRPVAEVEYWRDHYEVSDFLFPTRDEVYFNAFRCILKREPTFADSRAALESLDAEAGKEPSARPRAVQILNLIHSLLLRRIELDFAPNVQIYHEGRPVDPAALRVPAFAMKIEQQHENALKLLGKLALAPPSRLLFATRAQANLFNLLLLPGEWFVGAVTEACARAGRPVCFTSLTNVESPSARFKQVLACLSAAGVRPTDVFLMDQPIASPIDPQCTVYCAADFWPLEGDEFLMAAVRAVEKREAFTSEAFRLGRILSSDGKLGVLKALAARNPANARILLLDQAGLANDLDRRVEELQPIVRQFRSPISGGWQVRNLYLETRRNVGRQWLRTKQHKDIWWAQSGQDIDRLSGAQ